MNRSNFRLRPFRCCLTIALSSLLGIGACNSSPPTTGDVSSDAGELDAFGDVGTDLIPDVARDTDSDTTPDSIADTVPDAAPDTDQDTELDTPPDTDPDAADVDPDTPSDADVDALADADADTLPDADTDPDTPSDADADALPDADPDTAPDADPDTPPDADVEPDPDVAPDPDAGPIDFDEDGHPEDVDCDDRNPDVFPGATEVCNGIDDNCVDGIDEGVITDGDGCRDPGPPTSSATVDVVQFTIRSGDTLGGLNVLRGHRQGGADVTLDLCIDDLCWDNVNHPNWDDLMPRSVDVFTFEDVGIARADAEEVRFHYDDGTNWEVDCVQVTFDGETVYCREGIDVTLDAGAGDEDWSAALGTTECTSCWDSPLTHGPMVGATTDTTVRLWGRADSTRRIEVHVAPAGLLGGAEPVVYVYPEAEDDFTFIADVEGLRADTEYDYEMRADGSSLLGGSFRTAPGDVGSEVTIAIASCAKTVVNRDPEQVAFEAVAAEDPDLFFFVGDNVYFDPLENIVASDPGVTRPTVGSMRQHYRDQIAREPSWSHSSSSVWADFGRDFRADFLATTPTLTSWDDHDFLGNNTYGVFGGVVDTRRERAVRTFREYWANPPRDDAGPGIHYAHRWGDLEFFIVDNRYFRDPEPPSGDPIMLGGPQIDWLIDAVSESDATFKFIVNGSGWSTEASNDAYGGYAEEQVALMDGIAAAGVDGVVLISGDVHRSEFRMLPGGTGGYSLPEIISSPIANTTGSCHTTNDYVHTSEGEACYPDRSGVNPSYVVLSVDTTLSDPTITARMRDETGALLHSWTIQRSDLVTPDPVALPPDAVDFDGDGYADLLIGVPEEALGTRSNAGTVVVLPGSTVGLRSFGYMSDTQSALGFAASPAGARYGQALATGDFDGDGYTDAAFGSPDDIEGGESGGSVVVAYGGPEGLASGRTPLRITQTTTGMPGTPEAEDDFGAALAAGEFNCDAYDDLAIGTPGENDDEGHVYVIYGSSTGLRTSGGVTVQDFEQDDTSSGSVSEDGDRFGDALLAGDFRNAGCEDLVVGVPEESLDGDSAAGLVEIINCSCGGGLTTTSRVFTQDTDDIPGSPEAGDRFGATLARGNFNNDDYEDLVIAAPDEAIDSVSGTGYLFVLLGGPTGPSPDNTAGTRIDWHADSGPLDFGTGTGDAFGAALTASDFDNDGFDDLAVGIPGRSVGGDNNAGAVAILFGSSGGVTGLRTSLLSQDDSRWMGAESGDRFGAALASGDFNADGFADLAASAPDETLSGAGDAGATIVFLGSATGPTAGATDQRWHQDIRRLADQFAVESGDRFGSVLAD